MTLKKTIVLTFVLALALPLIEISLQAQGGGQFMARLTSVPPVGIAPATVAGIGSASATLSGRKLTVNGTFEKMASAPTSAHLCIGPVTGVRGEPAFDLTVSKTGDGRSGSLSGSFDLNPQQVEALQKGRIYILIQSEGAPNGHLWGWLLK